MNKCCIYKTELDWIGLELDTSPAPIYTKAWSLLLHRFNHISAYSFKAIIIHVVFYQPGNNTFPPWYSVLTSEPLEALSHISQER